MRSPKTSTVSLVRWSDIELRGVAVELQLEGVPVLRFTQEAGPGTAQIELYPIVGPTPMALSVTSFLDSLAIAQRILDSTVLDPIDQE